LYNVVRNEDVFERNEDALNALEISLRIRKYYFFPHLEVPHVHLYIYT
jgi:hypothetical protein